MDFLISFLIREYIATSHILLMNFPIWFLINEVNPPSGSEGEGRGGQPLSTSFIKRPMIIFLKCIGSMLGLKKKKKREKKKKKKKAILYRV
jgi:hypothetical protein